MEKNKFNICLLGASFGTNNMGVNALTAGTLKAYFTRYPDGKVILLDYGKQEIIYQFQMGDANIPIELVNIRFSKKFYLKNNIAYLMGIAMIAKCIPFATIRKIVISKNSWLHQVSNADIIVSMAGGDSFSDIYGMRRFLYVSLPQLLALILGKKLILLPQTIGPFKSAAAKAIASFILRKATLIYSRDLLGVSETKKLLRAGKNDSKVRFCFDVGFVVDPVNPRELDLDGLPDGVRRDSPVVGFNISGLLFMGGYTQNNMFGLKINYRKLVYDVIEYLIREKGTTVLLVPHVFGTKAQSESDSAVCELIYGDLKQKYQNKLYLVRGRYDQGEIKHIIGQCDFFIGSRMHACIAALSQNIPAVSIAYSKKFIGVLQTIDADATVADLRKLKNEDILALIDRVYEKRAIIHRQLEQTMPGVKETVLRLFWDIESVV